MNLRFDGKVGLVTGAGAGMGRRYALELARRGASVVVNDLGGAVHGAGSDPSVAMRVVDEIVAAGGYAVPSTHSVATRDGGRAIVETALDAFDRVDILINNAGIWRTQPFAEFDFAALDAMIDVHLKGAFHVGVPAYQAMQSAGGGRIVNVSSNAMFGVAAHASYAAAKAGLIGLTRVLAVEGAEHRISANAIMPVAATRMSEDYLGTLAESLSPDFVVPTVCWLAHHDCPATGEIYAVGGGRVARVFLAETPGWTHTSVASHDVEAVRTHFEDIHDETGYAVPRTAEDDMATLVQAIS